MLRASLSTNTADQRRAAWHCGWRVHSARGVRREARRIADVLQTMVWRRLVTSRKDPVTGKSKSVRVWQRPKDDPLTEDHILNDF